MSRIGLGCAMRARRPELYGIPISELARMCHVSLRTARRWKAGTRCPPETALMILRGDLGCHDPEWSGWSIHRGKLFSPEGWDATPGEILGLPILRLQVQNYQLQERIARRALEALDEQPLPNEIPNLA